MRSLSGECQLTSALLFLVLLADNGTQTVGATVVSAWCENSLRLQLSPTQLPPDVASTIKARDAMLRKRGLAAIPDALSDVGNCKPGAPTTLANQQPFSNGNLQVVKQSTSTEEAIVFLRVDTGQVLFTASARFEEQRDTLPPVLGACTAGKVLGHDFGTQQNVTVDAAVEYCGKQRGCVGFSVKQGSCFGGGVQLVSFKTKAPSAGGANTAATDNDTAWRTWTNAGQPSGYLVSTLTLVAGENKNERFYGLGQGNWTQEGGCPFGKQAVIPLERNGQTVSLQQRKFHVTIPFFYSTGGYGFLFNMPGAGSATMGQAGTGGSVWQAAASLGMSIWVTTLPATGVGVKSHPAAPIYKQYADATGHAPMLREDAMIFWQSRNRYKSSKIALDVASKYRALDLPVGVLVIDYENEKVDGDFQPNPDCYPSLSNLSSAIRTTLNATTMFSFWPEAKNGSANFKWLIDAGCVINADLGGYALDTTIPACRSLIWNQFLKPRYYDQGVSSYWLDETDGEGTGIGNGDYGYDTSWGPAAAYNNLWVGSWLSTFSDPVKELGTEPPLVLTRGTWAGGQKHGIVLWSSDIWSTFEELAAQVPEGVHASMSGIPWWTTDVGGYGCGKAEPNHSPYMQELMVRWYQFGCFSPIFRTHGCRNGPSEPDVAPCVNVPGSCGENEVWSYGSATQKLLEKYIRLRASLKPYIEQLASNVSAFGVPTVRPLWWAFPDDENAVGVDTQFMLGPDYLVAPVVVQNAKSRAVYFPGSKEVQWRNVFDGTIVLGGQTVEVDAPLEFIPVYTTRTNHTLSLV